MLQRAASNAYSWWWAGHIRTKQSKWLDQSLQDMDEKVEYVLKLIQEDGDSFAKRAEMYYKKRPELIYFVEESYRAFRALAERYDHLSTELQNANNTLATCFPDQIPMDMGEDDEYSPRIPKFPIQVTPANAANIPKVPKAPKKKLKGLLQTATKQLREKKNVGNSGLSKGEALIEIDKLQKDILALQTVKEYVKSSYQSGLDKYWKIENEIVEKNQKVCSLHDEFDIEMVIDDEEARKLMALTALRSCAETFNQLQEKQEKAAREAKEEYLKMEEARQRLESGEEMPSKTEDVSEKHESEQEQEFDVSEISDSITMPELVEKIDELVNKVISLESDVSSQSVLMNKLRSSADELHAQIRSLKDDKETLTQGKHELTIKVKELEEKLLSHAKNLDNKTTLANNEPEKQKDQLSADLSKVVETNGKDKKDFDSELSTSSKEEKDSKLSTSSKEEKDLKVSTSSKEEKDSKLSTSSEEGKDSNSSTSNKEEKDSKTSPSGKEGEVKRASKKTVTWIEPVELGKTDENTPRTAEQEEKANWQMMLLSGVENKENVLFEDYTEVLKNYKEVRKRLTDIEKEGQTQVIEFKSALAKRDEEIQRLRYKLNALGEDTDLSSREEINDINMYLVEHPVALSHVEEKLRMDIDAILEENLDFWLRFSTAFHQIQKFKSTVEDLQDEITKIKQKKRSEDSVNNDVRSDVRPIYKHMKEIEAELTVWLQQSVSLKEEMGRRSSSLSQIQEKITRALKEGVEEEEIQFSSHQAAKFQGEVLNMKQENNKVRDELEAGVDHITSLQVEVDRTLRKLNEDFGLNGDASTGNSGNKNSIPLRSFIFGAKPKKKQSIFSCMHPNKRYQVLRAGVPM